MVFGIQTFPVNYYEDYELVKKDSVHSLVS